MKSNIKHPDQPLIISEDKTIRFKENSIVRFLVNNYPNSLNAISMMNFSKEDYQQIMQLIGYSINGYCELSSVSEKSKRKHWKNAQKMT